MFSKKTIPCITQQSSVQKAHIVYLVLQRARAQRRGELLRYNVHYESNMYKAYTQNNEDLSVDSDSNSVTTTALCQKRTSETHSASSGCSCISCATSPPEVLDSEFSATEELIDERACFWHDSGLYSERVTCTMFSSFFNGDTNEHETMLHVRIRNLDGYNDPLGQKALDALQEFINAKRTPPCHSLITYANIGIQIHQRIHSQKNKTLLLHKTSKKACIAMQVSDDGDIMYTNVYNDNPRNILIYKQGHSVQQWGRYIPQIDYQCLYDSFDVLFAAIYAGVDMTQAMQDPEKFQRILHNMFHSMHFPVLDDFNVLDELTQRILPPKMPIADIVYSSDHHDNSVVITKLAHMSILIGMYGHLIGVSTNVATHMVDALYTDLMLLWKLRENLMPQKQEYDIFEYGIVPVIQDVLPYDYMQYSTELSVPAAPSHIKCLKCCNTQISTIEYIRNLFQFGSQEMCTWGCAITCLTAAIKEAWSSEAISTSAQINMLIDNIGDLGEKIDTRFKHFTHRLEYNVCKRFAQYNMRDLSGGAMPLFCMAICNVLSLYQALDAITHKRNRKQPLNKAQLMQPHKTIYNLTELQDSDIVQKQQDL